MQHGEVLKFEKIYLRFEFCDAKNPKKKKYKSYFGFSTEYIVFFVIFL